MGIALSHRSMNITALSSLTPSLFDTTNNVNQNKTIGSNSNPFALLGTLQDGTPSISPAAKFLNELQQLQQQNPDQFKKVASQIATNLQNAATTAKNAGDTTEATALTNLANQFQTSATTGQLPPLQALQQAAGAAGHHHGHHGHHGGGGASSTDLLNLLDPSTTQPNTVSTSPLTAGA